MGWSSRFYFEDAVFPEEKENLGAVTSTKNQEERRGMGQFGWRGIGEWLALAPSSLSSRLFWRSHLSPPYGPRRRLRVQHRPTRVIQGARCSQSLMITRSSSLRLPEARRQLSLKSRLPGRLSACTRHCPSHSCALLPRFIFLTSSCPTPSRRKARTPAGKIWREQCTACPPSFCSACTRAERTTCTIGLQNIRSSRAIRPSHLHFIPRSIRGSIT